MASLPSTGTSLHLRSILQVILQPVGVRHKELILVSVDLRFYRDPATGQPHIWNHDVDEVEVEQVLANSGEDRPGRDASRVAIGQTEAGRYLKVIYVRDSKRDSVFVITAYELRGNPLLAYRKRQRKKRS